MAEMAIGKYTFFKTYICAGFYPYKSKTLTVFLVILSPTTQDYLDWFEFVRRTSISQHVV